MNIKYIKGVWRSLVSLKIHKVAFKSFSTLRDTVLKSVSIANAWNLYIFLFELHRIEQSFSFSYKKKTSFRKCSQCCWFESIIEPRKERLSKKNGLSNKMFLNLSENKKTFGYFSFEIYYLKYSRKQKLK